MKKIIALVLALVLSTAMMVPANAAGDTYTIFAAETDDGCGIHASGWGRLWGPVGENEELGHPAPVQGLNSYCVNTTTDKTVLYHNVDWNTPATTTGVFNASNYEYIELDVYCTSDIVFNWEFGLCASETDSAGASWGLQNAWLPGKRWTHIKMPISEFGDFPAAFPGTMSQILRIKMQLTNIIDCYDMLYGSQQTAAPLYTYVYFDNVVATKGSAGKDSELITMDEMLANPPAWYDDYIINFDPIVIEPPAVIFGDTDDDGDVDATDALTALQHSVGKIKLSGVPLSCADVNADEKVDATDALLILQYSVGKIDLFPREVVSA